MPRPIRCRLALLAATVSALSATSLAARAAALRDATQVAAHSVEVVVIASEEELERLRATLGPNAFDGAAARWTSAARLELGELLDGRPDVGDVDVRAFVDLSDERNASLYFADRSGERFLVRAVALPDGLTPLGREALAQVLELSVRALLEDEHVGMTRAETSDLLRTRPDVPSGDPQPSADAAADPRSPPSTRSSLAAEPFYAARAYSGDVALVHGPGLAIGWLGSDGDARNLVWIAGQYELRQQFDTSLVGVEWSTVRLLAGGALAYAVSGSRLFLGGRLGAGADFTSFSPRPGANGDRAQLEPSRVATAPVVNVAFEASLPLAERLDLSAQAFFSVHPVRVHFELEREAERSRVLVPFWVRPGLALSLLLR